MCNFSWLLPLVSQIWAVFVWVKWQKQQKINSLPRVEKWNKIAQENPTANTHLLPTKCREVMRKQWRMKLTILAYLQLIIWTKREPKVASYLINWMSLQQNNPKTPQIEVKKLIDWDSFQLRPYIQHYFVWMKIALWYILLVSWSHVFIILI